MHKRMFGKLLSADTATPTPDAEQLNTGVGNQRIRSATTGVCAPGPVSRLDPKAQIAVWFSPRASTFGDTNILRNDTDGGFMITSNPSRIGDFVLFYKFQGIVQSINVLDTPDGLHFPASHHHFACLSDLVKFYSSVTAIQSKDLPCVLRITGDAASADTPTFARRVMLEGSSAYNLSLPPRTATMSTASATSEVEYAAVLPVMHSPSDPRTSAEVDDAFRRSTEDSLPRFGLRTSEDLRPSESEHEYHEIGEVDGKKLEQLKTVKKGQQQLRIDPFVDSRARAAPWCGIGFTKERALAMLKGGAVGAFVVRGSSDYFGSLSMVVTAASGLGTELYHAHIERTAIGIHLKKSDQFFPCLTALINYYRQPFQSDLPCPLLSAFQDTAV